MGKFSGRLVTLSFREFEVEKIIKKPRTFQAFSIHETPKNVFSLLLINENLAG